MFNTTLLRKMDECEVYPNIYWIVLTFIIATIVFLLLESRIIRCIFSPILKHNLQILISKMVDIKAKYADIKPLQLVPDDILQAILCLYDIKAL